VGFKGDGLEVPTEGAATIATTHEGSARLLVGEDADALRDQALLTQLVQEPVEALAGGCAGVAGPVVEVAVVDVDAGELGAIEDSLENALTVEPEGQHLPVAFEMKTDGGVALFCWCELAILVGEKLAELADRKLGQWSVRAHWDSSVDVYSVSEQAAFWQVLKATVLIDFFDQFPVREPFYNVAANVLKVFMDLNVVAEGVNVKPPTRGDPGS
jgi:hypothetical protein